MDKERSKTLGFEFVDIEIIRPLKDKVTQEKWDCDHCSLYFLSQEKLNEHKQRHNVQLNDETIKCKYCNKIIVNTAKNKVCYANRKCETCEYRCSFCPKRFLRHSSLMNHERNHRLLKKNDMNIKPTSKSDPAFSQKSGTAQTKLPIIMKKNKNNLKERAPKRKALVSNNSEKCLDYEISLPATRIKKRKVSVADEEINNLKEKRSNARLKEKSAVIPSKILPPTKKIKIEPKETPKFQSSPNESVINYRPFSCHVCGNTFASESALVNHIKSHGENAAKAFKCKYCGDEFGDVYKMQFHLAICPLADDELECTIIQNVSTKVPLDNIHYNSQSPTDSKSVIKMSRKKEQDNQISQVHSDTTIKNTMDKATPLQSTRRSQRKKNTVNNLASSSFDYYDSTLKKTKHNSNSTSLLVNKTNELQVSYEEFLNSDPEEGPLENIEINFYPQNASPGQSLVTSEDHRVKEHICPFPRCGMKFSREKALLCHMRNHSDDFEDTLKCHKCDIPFEDLHSLRLHVNVCKGIREEKDDDFNQPDCTGSKTKNRFSPHSRNELLCKVCGKTYKTVEKLNRHVLRHGSTNIMCRICNQVFNSQLLLDKHNFVRHPIKSPYYCKICNENFISDLFLEIHKSDFHGDEVNNTAPQDMGVGSNSTSKKPSTRLKILKKHDKPSTYVGYRFTGKHKTHCWCPVCHERFNERASMRYHLNHHFIVKSKSMYICEVCKMTKPTAEMLRCHLELHSIDPLSVNRFSKLRRCIDNENTHVLNIKHNKSFIKSENLTGHENTVEIKQEVSDETTPKRIRRNVSRKSEAIHTAMTKSFSRSVKMVSTTTQLVKDVSPQLTGEKGRKKRKGSENLLNYHQGKDLVDSIQSHVEGIMIQNKTTTVNKIMKDTQIKSEDNVKKKRRGKRRSKIGRRKKTKSIKKEILDDEVALDYINTPQENGFSPKEDCLSPFHSDSQTITDEDTNKEAEKKCDSLEASGDEASGSLTIVIDGNNTYNVTEQVKLVASTASEHEEFESFRSENEADDEIHCTMCSLKFSHQDDLLDHVGTHI